MFALPITCGGFSDSEFDRIRRAFADLPEFQEPRRERSGRAARGQGRRLVILDGQRVRVLMRRLGLNAKALAERARIRWGLNDEIIDYGELAVAKAERLAKALGVPVAEITYGVRTA